VRPYGPIPPVIMGVPSSMPLLHTLYLMGRGAVDPDGNSIAGGGPRLSGVMPSWGLPSLKYIGLSRNAISGSIPQTIGESSNLNQMWACSNQLSGIIPEGVTKLPLILRRGQSLQLPAAMLPKVRTVCATGLRQVSQPDAVLLPVCIVNCKPLNCIVLI
jgi:hypothetical protein